MKLKAFYQKVVQVGIEADIRGKKEIAALLKKTKADYAKLSGKEKEFFDSDSLLNPFADTRILCGRADAEINSLAVGIDLEGPEMLLIDKLKSKGRKIDLAVAHHPEGRAFAGFHQVMDLQIDAFAKKGVALSAAEKLLGARQAQVARRVHAANHQRSVDMARLLGINYMCLHTPADNLAYQYIEGLFGKNKPRTLGQIMELLYNIPEYKDAAKNSNAPKIMAGGKQSRASRILVEFTGGTEGPREIYEKLAASGVDTVVAMHQSEENYKRCEKASLNVIFASHIASDNLGMNLMLDKAAASKMKIYELSGFRRVVRKK